VADREVTKDQWRDILRMLREQNAAELAYATATEYATRAKSSLEIFPPSRERDALVALADYVLSRDR
jgi:octaprenyl-diphosphate synthase